MKNALKLSGLCLAGMCSLSAAAEERLATFKVMKPELALELAQATLESCRKRAFRSPSRWSTAPGWRR